MVAEWSDRFPRSPEIAGSSLGQAKPKPFELLLFFSSVDAQHLEDKTRTGWPGVRIIRLGGAFVSAAWYISVDST